MSVSFNLKDMLTISVKINDKTVYARSAHRRTKRHAKGKEQAYLTDAGVVVYHDPDDGVIKLAQKILGTIKEI